MESMRVVHHLRVSNRHPCAQVPYDRAGGGGWISAWLVRASTWGQCHRLPRDQGASFFLPRLAHDPTYLHLHALSSVGVAVLSPQQQQQQQHQGPQQQQALSSVGAAVLSNMKTLLLLSLAAALLGEIRSWGTQATAVVVARVVVVYTWHAGRRRRRRCPVGLRLAPFFPRHFIGVTNIGN